MNAEFSGTEYVCTDLFVKDLATMQAYCVLRNSVRDVDTTAPASSVLVDKSQPNASFPTYLLSSDAEYVNHAMASVKQNLCRIRTTKIPKTQSHLEVIEFRPALAETFGLSRRRRAEFTVLADTTQKFDPYFGERWDLLVDGTCIIRKLCFYISNMSGIANSPSKLICQIHVMNCDSGTDAPSGNYRDAAFPRMMDKYLRVSDPASSHVIPSSQGWSNLVFIDDLTAMI